RRGLRAQGSGRQGRGGLPRRHQGQLAPRVVESAARGPRHARGVLPLRPPEDAEKARARVAFARHAGARPQRAARAGPRGGGADLARTLGNLPSNICTPSYLAEEAKKLARQFKLQLEVLERRDLERLGMGAFLAVTNASHQPPKLIVLRYNGAGGGKGKGRAP